MTREELIQLRYLLKRWTSKTAEYTADVWTTIAAEIKEIDEALKKLESTEDK